MSLKVQVRAIKDTVSKQSEHNEVDGGPHAGPHSSLRTNAIVHHLVPVLSRQDLRKHMTFSTGLKGALGFDLVNSCEEQYSADLKHGHDRRRKGVEVCRGVVFKDEPVK